MCSTLCAPPSCSQGGCRTFESVFSRNERSRRREKEGGGEKERGVGHLIGGGLVRGRVEVGGGGGGLKGADR